MSLFTCFKQTELSRRQRALRAVNRREITGRDLAYFFGKLLVIVALAIAFIVGWVAW
jgi:hypothetical protein